MAKRFAVKGKNGDYRYFSPSAIESRRLFLNSRPFGAEWHEYLAQGYSLVQVDIREVAVIDGQATSKSR